MEDWQFPAVGGLVFVLLAVCTVLSIVKSKPLREQIARQEEAEGEREFEIAEMRATVVSQSCGVYAVGIKTPKTVREFTVVFRLEDGTMLKVPVPEEAYDGFEEGQTGVLTLVEGEMYSYVLDEA